MPALYLADPFQNRVVAPAEPSEFLDAYVQLIDGVTGLCKQREWTMYRRGITHNFDRVDDYLARCVVRVAIRLPNMQTATNANWEFLRVTSAPCTEAAPKILIFKVRATVELDGLWKNTANLRVVVGNVERALAEVTRMMADAQ